MARIIEKLGLGLVLLALLIVAVSLQSREIIVWFSVKPNLILGVLIGAVLLLDRNWYFTLLLIGAVGLEFYPGIGRLALAMAIAGAVNYWLKKKFLADGVVALSVLALVGTVVFYLALAPSFLFSHMGLVFLEAVYNLVVGALILGILKYLFGDE